MVVVHFVIMGCGRVGARLASTLDAAGHSVAVIDQDSKAFSRLSPDFSGRRVTGVGMDRDCLRQANIKDAYAFAAVSSGDNSNIIAARVAREVFHVEHVVARIYDPTRAYLYERLGIPTVASVQRTTESVMRRLLPPDASLPQLVQPELPSCRGAHGLPHRLHVAPGIHPHRITGSGGPGARSAVLRDQRDRYHAAARPVG